MKISTAVLSALLSVSLPAGLLLALPTPALAAAPDAAAMLKMLQVIDDRQRNSGDYNSLVYIEQKEAGKADLVYQATTYRRDASDKLVILFVKPKEEAGKGYLRVDKSLFFYDPTVGKWERRTEREKIGGTDSSRADFDESRLADEYVPAFVADEALGKYQTHHLKLTAKTEADVAYPVVEMWIDGATGNTLKRQDFALSGRLMRTTYYPEWLKVYSPSKGGDVYYPKEIRIYDEVVKGTSTTIVIQSVDLKTLDDSIFTKAWLESKSR
jgi:hypothetical protein